MAGDMPYNMYAYDSYGTQTGDDYYNEDFGSYKGYDKGPFGYKTGVRHYDPETGRFLSPDPFKGYMTDPQSQHPYMYCHGNPVKFADPSGYKVTKIVISYKKATATIFFDDKKPLYTPVAVAAPEHKESRIPPGTTMYIAWWQDDYTSTTFTNTTIPWSQNHDNPYGPAIAILSKYSSSQAKAKGYKGYNLDIDNPWDSHIHGTWKGIPSDYHSIKGLNSKKSEERAFTHGCTRFNNKVILMLRKEAPNDTPIEYRN